MWKKAFGELLIGVYARAIAEENRRLCGRRGMTPGKISQVNNFSGWFAGEVEGVVGHYLEDDAFDNPADFSHIVREKLTGKLFEGMTRFEIFEEEARQAFLEMLDGIGRLMPTQKKQKGGDDEQE